MSYIKLQNIFKRRMNLETCFTDSLKLVIDEIKEKDEYEVKVINEDELIYNIGGFNVKIDKAKVMSNGSSGSTDKDKIIRRMVEVIYEGICDDINRTANELDKLNF